MKKSVLFAGAMLALLGIKAQTTIFSDNFDSYPVGSFIAVESDDWNTWTGQPGSIEDGPISDDFAFSGSNSLYIENYGIDVIKEIGPYTSGVYDIKFKMYMPSGNGGYFNVMHEWDLQGNWEWACDVYFSSTGSITWTTEGVDGGGSTFTPATWFDVQVSVDMDNDIGELYINGNMVESWQWSRNNADGMPGQNRLAAIDFFGFQPAGSGPGLYYVDDFEIVEQEEVVSVDEPVAPSFAMYPNPANDRLWVKTDGGIGTVRIFDLSGKIVQSTAVNAPVVSVNTANLPEGMYLVEYTGESLSTTQRLMINR